MGRSGTEHPVDGRRASEVTVDELVAVLLATPYHEWEQLRPVESAASSEVWLLASAQAQRAWSDQDRREEIRRALVTAATEIVLAMPQDHPESDSGLTSTSLLEHVQKAHEALQAARELSPGLAEPHAPAPHRSAAAGDRPSAVAC